MPANDGKKWIYDHWNYIDPDEWKDAICDYYEIGIDGYGDLSDEEKYRVLAFYEETDYEDEKANIQAVIGDAKVIANGTAGLWNGTFEGGFLADDLQDAIHRISGNTSGDIGFYVDEDGELHMTFSHHDGTHDVVLRAVTSEGCDYIDDMEYELAEQDIERDVFNGYSMKIDVLGA